MIPKVRTQPVRRAPTCRGGGAGYAGQAVPVGQRLGSRGPVPISAPDVRSVDVHREAAGASVVGAQGQMLGAAARGGASADWSLFDWAVDPLTQARQVG